jgi:predicted Zn-dependent protease
MRRHAELGDALRIGGDGSHVSVVVYTINLIGSRDFFKPIILIR